MLSMWVWFQYGSGNVPNILPVQIPQILWFLPVTVYLHLENFKVLEKVYWEFRMELGEKSWKSSLTHSFLLTSASPTYELHLKSLWRIKMCPWLRSCFLQTPERAADPLCPNTSVNLLHHPRAQAGRAGSWVLKGPSLHPSLMTGPCP